MDEVVKLVSEKTGLDEETSKVAVVTVLDYLKGRLPESIAGQVDTVIAGGDVSGGLGDLAGGLGGMFGNK
jgi:hypothetical protein